MARMIINRILFCLIIMSLFMVLTASALPSPPPSLSATDPLGSGLQLGWVYSATAAPPIATTILFKLFLKLRFDNRFSWYIPDQVEIEQAHVHSSDAQKDRLLRRFGHPSLHAELFTPMLHEKHQHLLSRVYTSVPASLSQPHEADADVGVTDSGVTSEKEPFEDHMVDGAVAGGLVFTGIGQDDLEYSRMQYLRERDADTMSISTASVFSRNRGVSLGEEESKLSSPYSDRMSSYLAGAPSPPLVDGMPMPYSPVSFGERASSYMGVLPYGSQDGSLSPPQRPSQIKWASDAPSSIIEQQHQQHPGEAYPPSMPMPPLMPPPHHHQGGGQGMPSSDRFSAELGPYSSEVVVPHSLVPGGGGGGGATGGFSTPAEAPSHSHEGGFDGYATPIGRGGHDSFDDPRPPGSFGFPQSPDIPPRRHYDDY